MENSSGNFFNNPVHLEPSVINENRPHSTDSFDDSFNLDSPLVQCTFPCAHVKPSGVLKQFCNHSDLAWEHENTSPNPYY